jgi:aspartate/methionine/tyrosine aminotransferase
MLAKVYHTTVPKEAVIGTSGVTGALFAALEMMDRKGVKKIGLTNPFYTYHLKHIDIISKGGKAVYVQLETENDSFDINWKSLEEQLADGMQALIICNPGNPTGKVYSRKDLDRVVELTAKHNCYLILDEIYADLVWEGNVFYSPIQEQLHKHVISCRGFSKNLACQSWRLGFLVSHPDTVTEILNFHDPVYISVPILQHAVATYLRENLKDYQKHIQVCFLGVFFFFFFLFF